MKKSLVLIRWNGLGDVCMALCAAHAASKTEEFPSVTMATSEAFAPLVYACPWVTQSPSQEYDSVDLSYAYHGLREAHEVASFIQLIGLNNIPAEDRSLDLVVSDSAYAEVAPVISQTHNPRVLLHVGITDPNRTWPRENWQVLTTALAGRGYQVIFIGQIDSPDGRGAHNMDYLPECPGPKPINMVGKLSLLGTVALMRQSDLLVSADSGPIQLAGASDIRIVGFYSVVRGKQRFPYRHGELGWRCREVSAPCPMKGCYKFTGEPTVGIKHLRELETAGFKHFGQVLGHWCPAHSLNDPHRFHCMTEGITPGSVFCHCLDAMSGV